MANNQELEKLFQGSVQSNEAVAAVVPSVDASQQAGFSGANDAVVTSIRSSGYQENTLDEPVWKTLRRDLARIVTNLKIVVIPFAATKEEQQQALRNWDLWGPMIFTLIYAMIVSVGIDADESTTFTTVFTVVALGVVVLTVNVGLLGGSIVFFQSFCLLGYCLFPLDVAAIVNSFISLALIRLIVVGICLVWAFWAAVPFIGDQVESDRRALAIYPVILLYVFLAWFALIL